MPKHQYPVVQDLDDRLKASEAGVRPWIKEAEPRAIDIGKIEIEKQIRPALRSKA